MDFDRIEKLLAKYWECETTLQEEEELRKFFNTAEVPKHLAEYAPLFQYYSSEKQKESLDSSFDEAVLRKIGESTPKRGKVVTMFYDISKIAAAILVIAVATYFIQQEYNDKKEEMPYLTDTIEDPQKAFEETKKALQMISANFNKGRKQAQKVAVFNEAKEKAQNIEKEL